MKAGVFRWVRFRYEVAIVRLILFFARIVPRRVLLALGSMTGRIAYRFDARHRNVALNNLNLAFGLAPDDPEARRIVKACWCHFARITVDTLAFSRFDASAARALVQYEGLEHIREAYARGKGVLLFSGHFGHWELTALMQGYLGLPLALVTRPLDNPELERLLAAMRSRSGNRIIHKRLAVRAMMKALREGIGVAIVIDQDARGDGVFVPFFGHPASTTPTLALLALRTGAAVVPTYSVPLADGSYRIVYEPPLSIESTGDRDADVMRITTQYTAIVEGWVRQYPELWLWMHRRWKTKPSPDPSG